MAIKEIIKRDGSVEPFDVSKLNKWQRWASYGLESKVQWTDVVTKTLSKLSGTIDSQLLQKELIKTCEEKNTWSYSIMAGRLYNSIYRKRLFSSATKLPTVKEVHQKLINLDLMVDLGYSDDEYEQIEKIINHNTDFEYALSQVEYIEGKYAIKNTLTGEVYETPQYVFMRMAMHLAADETEDKLYHVGKFYYYLSKGKLNAPTPNYQNLGTKHRGFSSCCLYKAADTAESLAVGDHIAYTMTYMSAGIGSYIESRSILDPVRNGKIKHQGKIPYFKSLAAAVCANTQGGRGGAATTYITCYDPEASVLITLGNPRTPTDIQNRDIHYALSFNDFFFEKLMKKEDIFTFNVFTAPDLQEAFFKNDGSFKELYEKYEKDPNFKKNYINTYELASVYLTQCQEVATTYAVNITEVNRHTSFIEPIYSSNLCLEITQPTKAYREIIDLYAQEDNDDLGEISLCSLAGIAPGNIDSEEEYEEVSYYALKMIDRCIDLNDYKWPHLKLTATSRRNAGVGIIGLAYDLAKHGYNYTSKEGLNYIHRVCERHAYYLISASLRLAKERGNAPWMHKTKWPSGWLPIDTYNKNVDLITTEPLYYDWEGLRQQIIEQGGIRNSSLIAHMPSESSSKATGVPNGIYPIRDQDMIKTDKDVKIKYVAKENDIYGNNYQIAWDIDPVDLIKFYAVVQKFTDQAISADIYENRVRKPMLKMSDLMKELIAMYKYGVKTRYYTNSYTLETFSLDSQQSQTTAGCASGVCTL